MILLTWLPNMDMFLQTLVESFASSISLRNGKNINFLLQWSPPNQNGTHFHLFQMSPNGIKATNGEKKNHPLGMHKYWNVAKPDPPYFHYVWGMVTKSMFCSAPRVFCRPKLLLLPLIIYSIKSLYWWGFIY